MIKNIIIGVVALVAIVLAVNYYPQEQSFGNSTQSFWNTSEGYRVDGVSVIDGSSRLNALESTETITVDDTLTVAERGKVVYIGTAGVDITLPAAASSAGVSYRVVVSANFATTNMTITGGASDASDDLIYGVLDVAGAVVLCAAEDTISFVNTAELIGDYVELRSNGTNWLLSGQAGATGAITCTDAD